MSSSKSKAGAKTSDGSVMPLGEHLEELRKRLVFGLLGLLPLAMVCLYFGEPLLDFLITPVQDALTRQGLPRMMQVTGPLELFSAYISISLITTAILGAPWILIQLWLFIAPGLYDRERRFVYILLPLSAILTITGMVFLFRVIMPLILAFVVSFGAGIGNRTHPVVPLPEGATLGSVLILEGDPPSPKPGQEWIDLSTNERRVCTSVTPDGVAEIYSSPVFKSTGVAQQYRVKQYLDLLTTLTIAFAAGFQTPVIVLVLGWAGLVTPAFLRKYRKHAVLVTAIVGAAATPGDPSSMIALWVPLMLLYELGIVLLQIFPAHRVSRGFTKRQRERALIEEKARSWFGDDDEPPTPTSPPPPPRDQPPRDPPQNPPAPLAGTAQATAATASWRAQIGSLAGPAAPEVDKGAPGPSEDWPDDAPDHLPDAQDDVPGQDDVDREKPADGEAFPEDPEAPTSDKPKP